MTIEQNRAKITGRIWQAVAESGVKLDAIPRDQAEKLVGAITDSMLLTLNELLGETAPQEAAPQIEGEQTLWEGRPFLSVGEHYLITTERLRITRGVLGKEREDVDLFRIVDIDQSQNLSERLANIGDITLRSDDTSKPEVVLRNVHDPLQVHEILRTAVNAARERRRVVYRDIV